jgi:two-component system NtrC family sensor kinase
MRSEKLSSLGKLSAGIAHEINQPLTGVLTFASLLQKKYKDDDPTRKDLEIIVRETKRIRGIVQRVLDFARETPLKKKALQIQQIVDQTLGIVEHQECFFGVTIKKEYDLKVPEVVIDPSQMEQVFLNIILNAADAMNGSGTLTVRTRADQKWVMVDLEDTGRGMPEEIIDKIFDPFFTTKDSTEGSGMGLGLALSYGIVKNHDGDIRVKSKVGKGTTFTITLPLTKPGEKKPAAP